MAKLTEEQIAQELKEKGYELVDASEYTNMRSLITVKCCAKGHIFKTSFENVRSAAFECPNCDSSITFVNPKEIPTKEPNVKRIISFDQATENFGLAIFDNGKLVFYQLYNFRGSLVNRLMKIRNFLKEFVFEKWQPDKIIMEDIQYQNNGLLTYKALAMLLGVVQELCEEEEVEYEAVSPNVWRKYAGTAGKTRREEKMLSVAVVKDKYGITVIDDIAEAILIGRYAVKTTIFTVKTFGKVK